MVQGAVTAAAAANPRRDGRKEAERLDAKKGAAGDPQAGGRLAWWKKGSVSALSYMAMMWLMIVAAMYFVVTFDAYARGGKTQIYADLLADGACFVGDNGWGLDEQNAGAAIRYLERENSESFEDADIELEKVEYVRTEYESSGGDEDVDRFATTDRSAWDMSDLAKADDWGDNPNNTVHAYTKLDGEKKYGAGRLSKTADAATRITYSGGFKIVREAWKHTYEHCTKQGRGGSQTPYVWGGGHGGEGLACLTNGADCSGFVSAIFQSCGFEDVNGCTWDLEKCGRCVYDGSIASELAKSARPGDIILIWRNGSTADGSSVHVTIYAGLKDGEPWDVECHGSPSCTATSKGEGDRLGAHIDRLEPDCSRYKVMRMVDTNVEGVYVEQTDFSAEGMTAKVIMEGFALAGYTPSQTAAVMGNWQQESGVNPIMREGMYDDIGGCQAYEAEILAGMSQEDFVTTGMPGNEHGNSKAGGMTWPKKEGGGRRPEGYGLGQWTSESRKRGLYQLAMQMSSHVSDPYVQVAFAISEMDPTSPYSIGFNDAAFRGQPDVNAAAQYYLENFEGINDGTGPTRQANARAALAQYWGG